MNKKISIFIIIIIFFIGIIYYFNLKIKGEKREIAKETGQIQTKVNEIIKLDYQRFSQEEKELNKIISYHWKYKPAKDKLNLFIKENINFKKLIENNQNFQKQIKELEIHAFNLKKRDIGKSLTYLKFFIQNLKEAYIVNQKILENFYLKNDKLYELEERYFKSANFFKKRFFLSLQDKQIKGEYPNLQSNFIESFNNNEQKIVYKESGFFNNDLKKDTALVISEKIKFKKYKWFLKIYSQEEKKFKEDFNFFLGEFKEAKDGKFSFYPKSQYKRGLHLRFFALTPVILLIFKEYSGDWRAFIWDGKKYINLPRADLD